MLQNHNPLQALNQGPRPVPLGLLPLLLQCVPSQFRPSDSKLQQGFCSLIRDQESFWTPGVLEVYPSTTPWPNRWRVKVWRLYSFSGMLSSPWQSQDASRPDDRHRTLVIKSLQELGGQLQMVVPWNCRVTCPRKITKSHTTLCFNITAHFLSWFLGLDRALVLTRFRPVCGQWHQPMAGHRKKANFIPSA